MGMSKKDFIRIAEKLAQIDNETIREDMVKTHINILKDTNPRFSESKFRDFILKRRYG